MREWFRLLINYLIFAFVALALCTLQSTLWFQFFGHFPPPNFWMPVMVFWLLYRISFESVLMTYVISVAVSSISAIALPFLLVTNMIVLAVGFFVKRRLFRPTQQFFVMVCAFGTASLTVVQIFSSWIWEKNPMSEYLIFYTLIQALLTAVVALPLYSFFNLLDTWTKKERPADTGVLF